MVVAHQIQKGPKSRLWIVKNICLSLNIPIVQNYMKQSANKKKTFEFGRHYSEIFPTKLTIQRVYTHLEIQ